MSGIYLEEHPNNTKSQYRTKRRAEPSGAIVIHTAENTTDKWPPDGGAEGVARFISTRNNYGSYHSVTDSDSTVHVGRYEWEMFGEGTGGNRWALHLSFACQAIQWATLPSEWVRPAIANGAAEAVRMAAWVKATRGIIVPARRITAAEYRAKKPGFIGHGDLDPGRRSDPGSTFPWSAFFAGIRESADLPNHGDPDMTRPADILQPRLTFAQAIAEVEALYTYHRGGPERYRPIEIDAWAEDLHHKMYVEGIDIRPTLAFINHALSNEPSK